MLLSIDIFQSDYHLGLELFSVRNVVFVFRYVHCNFERIDVSISRV